MRAPLEHVVPELQLDDDDDDGKIYLPPDILLHIFSFCVESPRTYVCVTSTCRLFHILLLRETVAKECPEEDPWEENPVATSIRTNFVDMLEKDLPLRKKGEFVMHSYRVYFWPTLEDEISWARENVEAPDPVAQDIRQWIRSGKRLDDHPFVVEHEMYRRLHGKSAWARRESRWAQGTKRVPLRRYKVACLSDYIHVRRLIQRDRFLWAKKSSEIAAFLNTLATVLWDTVLPSFFWVYLTYIIAVGHMSPFFATFVGAVFAFLFLYFADFLGILLRVVRVVSVDCPFLCCWATDDHVTFINNSGSGSDNTSLCRAMFVSFTGEGLPPHVMVGSGFEAFRQPLTCNELVPSVFMFVFAGVFAWLVVGHGLRVVLGPIVGFDECLIVIDIFEHQRDVALWGALLFLYGFRFGRWVLFQGVALMGFQGLPWLGERLRWYVSVSLWVCGFGTEFVLWIFPVEISPELEFEERVAMGTLRLPSAAWPVLAVVMILPLLCSAWALLLFFRGRFDVRKLLLALSALLGPSLCFATFHLDAPPLIQGVPVWAMLTTAFVSELRGPEIRRRRRDFEKLFKESMLICSC